MEVNKEELRRLAEISISDMHAWPSEPSERNENLESFRLHANPTAILSLLDELDRKERVIHECSKDFDALQESIDDGYRARMKYKRERDQVRAENERLSNLICRLHPHLRGCPSDVWDQVNAAMAKEGSAHG